VAAGDTDQYVALTVKKMDDLQGRRCRESSWHRYRNDMQYDGCTGHSDVHALRLMPLDFNGILSLSIAVIDLSSPIIAVREIQAARDLSYRLSSTWHGQSRPLENPRLFIGAMAATCFGISSRVFGTKQENLGRIVDP
jgi:hypothetical protein